jgi:phosphotransferase system enzyme I (PtsP)
MNSDVCSIYLFEDNSKSLVLKANVGLAEDAADNVRMSIDEGIAGLTLRTMEIVKEDDASKNPNFKPFEGIEEEKYESFLAAPIHRGLTKIGVLMLQREKKNKFDDEDISAIKIIASQIANYVENARLFISVHEDKTVAGKDRVTEKRLIHARPAVDGICSGSSYVYEHRLETRLEGDSYYSIGDFDDSLKRTVEELEELQKKVERDIEDAASLIFNTHILMLKDRSLRKDIKDHIDSGYSADKAIVSAMKKYTELIKSAEDEYIKEKLLDIQDVMNRLIRNLSGRKSSVMNFDGRIIIAKELLPSDVLRLHAENAGGIILSNAGAAAHIIILAQSLKIPMLINDDPDIFSLLDNTELILDAVSGNIYIEPAADIKEEYIRKISERRKLASDQYKMLPKTISEDQEDIDLMLNVNLISDLNIPDGISFDGVGLYRTEFPFLVRNNFPSEEEQFLVYRKVIGKSAEKPVIFRTLDIGGDKVLSYYRNQNENNPFLGMRSIRFSLEHRDIFKDQLRAILRAGSGSRIKIMFPMISSVEEIDEAKNILDTCKEELSAKGLEYNVAPEIGIMVEVPSVIEIIEECLKRIDFISLGTNDLVQYMLASDRTNEKVQRYYNPYHPSVLRSVYRASSAAISLNKDVSICGDMASEPGYIAFLLGIGIRSFSVAAIKLLRVQHIISKICLSDAERLSEKVLAEVKVSDIKKLIGSFVENIRV